ncbi:endonuclease/exonuclease/phosphatase family protein [Thalassomonas viridans]|uniref:Endonuclease/exonuclease/phosphatase family protein n=1 Tax=Thalassomonas viridans TaxID=137584 RepID=A0AAE9Z432_9GAMM|nr:endonuclease/exonuclease/phosphatase family protein [Thalassomonas viridans]WDE04787.1 endonuclease/exonuclease/phosphatase family protein [Thalassomonas viridans]
MPNMRDMSFATFNLLNLQIPGGLTYSNKAPYPDDAVGRQAYGDKIDWIARQVRRLDADVIAFQELWSVQALQEVFMQAELENDYDLIARSAPGKGKPQVALAVRKDRHGDSIVVGEGEWIEAFPENFSFDKLRESSGAEEEITVTVNNFSRPVLHVKIQPQGRSPKPPEISIYVAHLKSKGPARISFAAPQPKVLRHHAKIATSAVSHIRRIMEAAAIRAMLDGVMKAEDEDEISPVVVLGDLNDDTQSVTNELLSDQPSYRVAEKSRAGRTSDKGLYAADRLQQYRSSRHVYYTHIYKHKLESLDHILVSEEFYDHSIKRFWSFRELEVYNDHLNRESFEEEGASDHGLVRAHFDWNPMPEEDDDD